MEQLLNLLEIAGATVFVFLALGFCIFSHELGHFLAAKWMGLHIDAFSLGFRPFWRKKYNGVEYRLGWLPFGGYVELPQVDASSNTPKSADGRELPRATPLARIVTAVAGPLFNILSGLLIGCIVWVIGVPQATPKMREMTVSSVAENSPEYRAGLRRGDVISKLNGETFFISWEKFVEKILYTIDEVTLDVRRDGKTMQIKYLPAENPDAPGNAGKERLAYPFFRVIIPIKLFPEPGSPAEKAGIRDGDILHKINGSTITGYENFQAALNFSDGKILTVELLRDDKPVTLQVTPQAVKNADFEELFLTGITMNDTASKEVKVLSVIPGGNAEKAGIMRDDILLAVDDIPLGCGADLQKYIAKKQTSPVKLTVKRNGQNMDFTLCAKRFAPYSIGVSLALYDHPTPFQQLLNSLEMSWKSLRGIATTIGNKLHLTESQSSLKPSHLSGPLGIGQVLFSSIRTSPAYGIYLVVVISFALAIFNLLPLPVLDGGHILFGVIEIIFRRPLPEAVIKYLSYIFVTLLIMLMVFATFYDGKRLVNQVGKAFQNGEKNASSNP